MRQACPGVRAWARGLLCSCQLGPHWQGKLCQSHSPGSPKVGKVWADSVRSTGGAGTLTRGPLGRYLLEPRKWEMGTVQVYPDCANGTARHVSSVGQVNM